jgi:hypothetical protein
MNDSSNTILKSVLVSVGVTFIILWGWHKYKTKNASLPVAVTQPGETVTIISMASGDYTVLDSDKNIAIISAMTGQIILPSKSTGSISDGRVLFVYNFSHSGVNFSNPVTNVSSIEQPELYPFEQVKLVYKLSEDQWYLLNMHNNN